MDYFLPIFRGLLIAAFVAAGLAILLCIVFAIRSAVNHKKHETLIMMLISCGAVLLSAAAFLSNLGWLRVILLWTLVPFIHTGVLFLVNYFASYYMRACGRLKLWSGIFTAAYVLFYLFLPDFGDIDSGYVFFGLIRGERVYGVCSSLCAASGVVWVAAGIIAIAEVIAARRAIKQAVAEL